MGADAECRYWQHHYTRAGHASWHGDGTIVHVRCAGLQQGCSSVWHCATRLTSPPLLAQTRLKTYYGALHTLPKTRGCMLASCVPASPAPRQGRRPTVPTRSTSNSRTKCKRFSAIQPRAALSTGKRRRWSSAKYSSGMRPTLWLLPGQFLHLCRGSSPRTRQSSFVSMRLR